MATEALAPYVRPLAFSDEVGPASAGAGSNIPEALFAFGGEAVSRPSATGRYLISDLEMELEAGELIYDLGMASSGRGKVQFEFDKDRGEIIVRLVVPEAAAERAVLEMQQVGHNVWDLNDLTARLAQSVVYEAQMAPKALADAAKLSPQAIADVVKVAPKAISEAAKAAPRAITDAVKLTPRAISEAVKGIPVRPQDAHVLPTPVTESKTVPETEPLPEDASVPQLTARLSALTGLSDDELAQVFLGRGSRERVSREHYQRWRTGKKTSATDANRRRMWFLVRLFEPLAQVKVGIPDWVRNASPVDELTPLELLQLGRFDEVEYLAARMMPSPDPQPAISAEGRPVLLEQGPATFAPRSEEPTTDLVFEEEDGWIESEDEMDDD